MDNTHNECIIHSTIFSHNTPCHTYIKKHWLILYDPIIINNILLIYNTYPLKGSLKPREYKK